MRCLVAMMLILLLPLRGWAGDAMAIQMALSGGMPHALAAMPSPQGAEHHAAMAPESPRQPTQAPHVGDCADHSADATLALDDHCPACTMCQACHNIAITLPASVPPDTGPIHPLPLLAARHFASADRAPGLKPPIS